MHVPIYMYGINSGKLNFVFIIIYNGKVHGTLAILAILHIGLPISGYHYHCYW